MQNNPASSGASPGSSENANAATGFDPAEFTNLKQELARTRETGKQNADTVGRLRQVFAPEETNKQDPNEAFLDHVLQQSLEAEKNGTPMPITTNLAVKLFETQKQLGEAMKTINELKGKTDQALDPVARVDQQTYANLDNLLQDSLYSMFGRENVSQAQYSSIASEITAEIHRLRAESPEIWEEVRRSPKHQKAMVRHYVDKRVPPAARKLMENDAIQKYEMTETDLINAFREADGIQNEEARQKVKTKIRQDLLERRWQANKRRR